MRKVILTSGVAAALALLASMPTARAAPIGQAAVADAAAALGDVVAVKGGGHGHGHGHGWGRGRHWHGGPPGWSRGRKVGWRGRGMPPGQWKKRWR